MGFGQAKSAIMLVGDLRHSESVRSHWVTQLALDLASDVIVLPSFH